MDLNSVLNRNPDTAYRIYEGKATVVLPGRSEVKVLNEIGSMVWDRLDGVRTLGQIVEALLEDEAMEDLYGVTRQQLEEDVMAFANEIREHGMVI